MKQFQEVANAVSSSKVFWPFFLIGMESMTYVALLPIQSQYVPVHMGFHFFLVLMRSITLTHCCSLLVENTFWGPFVRVARKNTTAVLKHMQSSTVLRTGLSRAFLRFQGTSARGVEGWLSLSSSDFLSFWFLTTSFGFIIYTAKVVDADVS